MPMENCIRETLEYARQRHVYGRPLLDNQVVHFRLAELQTEVEALRSLLYRALGKYTMSDRVYELCEAVSADDSSDLLFLLLYFF